VVPEGVPLHRTRAERFDDLVLQAVARLEPQWEAHLSGVEFAVEEIPPPDLPAIEGQGPVPLSRLDPGSPRARAAEPGGDLPPPDAPATSGPDGPDVEAGQDPPRIVVYRRPPMAGAGGEDELGDRIFEVVGEECARMLGSAPSAGAPGCAGDGRAYRRGVTSVPWTGGRGPTVSALGTGRIDCPAPPRP